MMRARRRLVMLRRRLYQALDPHQSGRFAEGFRSIHHFCVVLGIASVILGSVPEIAAAHPYLLALSYDVALAFFAITYLARLYIAPEAPWARHHPWRERLNWTRSPQSLVDLIATWPVVAASPFFFDPASLRLASIVWIFKFVPYSEGLALLARVIENVRATLASVLLSFLIVLLGAATLAYLFERDVQPKVFGSIPSGLWWAVVTLTTTGYGDAVPDTLAGRLLAGCVMVCGIALFALWAGIIANGFGEEIKRRDLARTWDLVTKVPLFESVGGETIAEVTRLLRPREVPEGAVIVRRGDPADSMYFIVSGEVEIHLRPKPVRLGAGSFFGEIALITGSPRSATIVAARPCVLLALHLTDFRHLAARRAELMRAIDEEAARRIAENRAAAQSTTDAGGR